MSGKMVIDLTNFKDRVGGRVEPGTYRVVVDDVEQDQSKAGNPMINVWFRVEGGQFDGATITDRLVLTEKSLFRVVGFLQALGYPTPRKKLQLDTGKWLNQRLEITVDDGEPYNGRVKSEVRGYAKIAKAEKQSEADLEDVSEDTADEAEEAPASAKAASDEVAAEDPWDGDDDDSQGEVDLDDLENL